MKRILITFERGGSFSATLWEHKAPDTCGRIWEILPLTSTAVHSRWSGREVNCQVQTAQLPREENQTIYTSRGEIVYWRDWRHPEPPAEVLAFYYGPEKSRSWRGPEVVNVIGQIDFAQLEAFQAVGERIWLNGTEKIRIERLEA